MKKEKKKNCESESYLIFFQTRKSHQVFQAKYFYANFATKIVAKKNPKGDYTTNKNSSKKQHNNLSHNK